MFRQEEVAVGGAMAGDAEAADQLDLEAAEQLIQLSGSDGGSSETRSADSVKCRGADQDQPGVKEKEVESRRRRDVAGKDGGDGGEAAGGPDMKSAHSIVTECPRAAASKEEPPAAAESRRRSAARFLAGKGVAGGAVDDGEERRRPRFRWLADIYRETSRLPARDPHAAGGNDVPPEAEERRKRKRAADADEEVAVPLAVMSKQSKEGTMAA